MVGQRIEWMRQVEIHMFTTAHDLVDFPARKEILCPSRSTRRITHPQERNPRLRTESTELSGHRMKDVDITLSLRNKLAHGNEMKGGEPDNDRDRLAHHSRSNPSRALKREMLPPSAAPL